MLPLHFQFFSDQALWRRSHSDGPNCSVLVKAPIYYQTLFHDTVWSNQLLREQTGLDITFGQHLVFDENSACQIPSRHNMLSNEWHQSLLQVRQCLIVGWRLLRGFCWYLGPTYVFVDVVLALICQRGAVLHGHVCHGVLEKLLPWELSLLRRGEATAWRVETCWWRQKSQHLPQNITPFFFLMWVTWKPTQVQRNDAVMFSFKHTNYEQ